MKSFGPQLGTSLYHKREPTARVVIRPPGFRSFEPITVSHAPLITYPKQYDLWTTPVIAIGDILNTGGDHDTPSISDRSSNPSTDSTPELSLGSGQSSSDDDLQQQLAALPLPSMELILPHRRLALPPSCFPNGCICGHQLEHRDVVYEPRKRKNLRSPGVTIRPKVTPVDLKLRK